MIKLSFLHSSNIDRKKWDNCIANAHNSSVYVYTWYLDAVAPHWEALILGDYEAVMPLPYNRKYIFKQVYQPFFVQQLGVFSIQILEKELFEAFLKAVKKRYFKVYLHLHESHTAFSIGTFSTSLRDNYILSLAAPYENIYNNFSHGLRQSIKLAQKKQLTLIRNATIPEIIAFYQQHLQAKTPEINEKALLRLRKLMENAIKHNKAFLYAAQSPEKNTVAMGFFLKNANRITYLVGVSSPEGKKIGAMPFLLSNVMQEYAEQPMIFDFEGSMQQGIASFFQSFGAQKIQYLRCKL